MFTNANDNTSETSTENMLYAGEVVENNDPLHLDRIKVRIPNMYDNERGELLWCLPLKTCVFGCGDNYGIYGVPPIGAKVIVELQQNNQDYPFYRHYLYTNGAQNAEFDAPSKYGFKDPAGNRLLVDTSSNTVDFHQASGVTFHFEGGTLTVTTDADVNLNISGNSTVNIGGNASVSVSGSTNVKSNGMNFDTPTATFTGTVTVAKGISSSSGGVTSSGGINNTGGNITSNGIVLETHVHSGVQGGPSNTGQPV